MFLTNAKLNAAIIRYFAVINRWI